MLQAVLATSASAVRISATLADHCGGRDVTPVDVAAGLLYRLTTPMDDSELDESMHDGREMADILLGPDSDCSEEEEEAETDLRPGSELSEHEAAKELSIATYSCNCPVCMRMRVCIANFAEYEPQDASTALMYRGLIRSLEKHDISIVS